jgi:hypothetical protein
MIAPPKYYKAIGDAARNGDPLAKQVVSMWKAQAIGAAIGMVPLFYVGWLMLNILIGS